MKQEESFGIIPLMKKEGRWFVFLIQHKKAKHWGLPKGRSNFGESFLESAMRELKEETNLECDLFLQKEPLVEEYQFFDQERGLVHKKVYYFVAQVIGEVKLQEEEVENGLWILLLEAIEKVTHQESQKILLQALRLCEID